MDETRLEYLKDVLRADLGRVKDVMNVHLQEILKRLTRIEDRLERIEKRFKDPEGQ